MAPWCLLQSRFQALTKVPTRLELYASIAVAIKMVRLRQVLPQMCSQLLLLALCMTPSACNFPACVLSCVLVVFASSSCCVLSYMLKDSAADPMR